MTDNLVPSEDVLKLAVHCEGWGGRYDAVEGHPEWRDVQNGNPARSTASRLHIGALDARPAALQKGTLVVVDYQLGALRNELALEITKFHTSAPGVARGSRHGAVKLQGFEVERFDDLLPRQHETSIVVGRIAREVGIQTELFVR